MTGSRAPGLRAFTWHKRQSDRLVWTQGDWTALSKAEGYFSQAAISWIGGSQAAQKCGECLWTCFLSLSLTDSHKHDSTERSTAVSKTTWKKNAGFRLWCFCSFQAGNIHLMNAEFQAWAKKQHIDWLHLVSKFTCSLPERDLVVLVTINWIESEDRERVSWW